MPHNTFPATFNDVSHPLKQANATKNTMTERRSSLCILAAGVLWGTLPLFIKYLAALGASPEQTVFVRVLFAAVIMTAWLAARNPSGLRIRIKDTWCFAGTGILSIMLFSYCYFRTVESANIALAALLLYTSPVFVLFFSILFFKERITRRKTLAVTSTVLGCASITGVFSQGAPIASPGVILIGLGAGLFYSLYTIFGKYALNRYSSVTVITYTFIFATIGTACIVPLPETLARLAEPRFLAGSVGIAVFGSVGAFSLYTLGLHGVSPSKAGVLATVEPVVATLIGILIFREDAGLATFAGMALILGATVLLSLESSGKPPQTDTPDPGRPS